MRWTHSPRGTSPACSGTDRCGNPTRVASAISVSLPADRGRGETRVDRYSGTPLGQPPPGVAREKRVRGRRVEARQGLREMPWKGQNPREPPAVGVLNTCSSARDSRKGQSLEAAARWNGLSRKRRDDRREKRHAGSSWAVTSADTFREGNASKGAIPWALPARNKAGAGSEGVSRQEGSQTLEAERSGTWKSRGKWTSGSWRAAGSKSPWEEPASCGKTG